ncbi:hypothetical protein GLOIN_2v1481953 [Rhizophagus irregularis DAOM 181602=DAOM 197198]|nr:hypothetical protein GLOIN_2v1481953 [Rhizophagus irregularis DAOM 181602=DAOM 197198]
MRDLQLWKTQFSYEKTLICLVRSVKEVGNRCIYGTVVEKTQFNSKGVGENKSKKSPSSKRTFPSLVVIFGYMGRLGRALQRFNQRLGRPSPKCGLGGMFQVSTLLYLLGLYLVITIIHK